jgi:HD-GYP domain-containing protein (c-di-GMP phosphodiesterase class II)
MSSDPQSASPSSGAEEPPADPDLAELVRLRGAPLLEALEAHSPGSRDHAEATGGHAFAAAVGIGLDRAAAELCRETAKLHDIGMVYVPAAVIQTPYQTWDPDQREAFEAHYEAGARLALGAGIPDEVCGWLLQIRERFDGQGPEGLAGSAIPVAARLARTACACDTLLASPHGGETLNERRSHAIARLRGAAGRELDPEVVDALVAAITRPDPG